MNERIFSGCSTREGCAYSMSEVTRDKPHPSVLQGFPHFFLKYLSVQATELSTLIPLALGCKRLILVGDPRQLPATVKSQKAAR